MAGYSGTPLAKKLGIRSGSSVCLVDAPQDLELELPGDVELARGLRGKGPFDVLLVFCEREAALRKRFAPAKERLAVAGGLWLCWPKQASGVPTDLDGDRVRAAGLAGGLVDNKVCAVNEVWSGLRFVRRLARIPHQLPTQHTPNPPWHTSWQAFGAARCSTGRRGPASAPFGTNSCTTTNLGRTGPEAGEGSGLADRRSG